MKMYYWKGPHPNFGDDLNLWLWPKIFPNLFDQDDTSIFLGIGSILTTNLQEQTDPTKKKIVFGCGHVDSYGPPPNVFSPEWTVYFVRGPRTARALGISADKAVGDSAILSRIFFSDDRRSSELVSFMPHHGSLKNGNWERVCEIANINFIDPRDPVESVFKELLRSKVVICEAMHGAILSDALRIPWIPVLPIRRVHRAKWYDWAEALDISLSPQRLFPSTLSELLASNMPNRFKPLDRTAGPNFINEAIAHASARSLVMAAKLPGSLSTDGAIDRATQKMLIKVEELKADQKLFVSC